MPLVFQKAMSALADYRIAIKADPPESILLTYLIMNTLQFDHRLPFVLETFPHLQR